MLIGYYIPFFMNMATSAARTSNPGLKAWSCCNAVLLNVVDGY
jgi:hypothetical protein